MKAELKLRRIEEENEEHVSWEKSDGDKNYFKKKPYLHHSKIKDEKSQ